MSTFAARAAILIWLVGLVLLLAKADPLGDGDPAFQVKATTAIPAYAKLTDTNFEVLLPAKAESKPGHRRVDRLWRWTQENTRLDDVWDWANSPFTKPVSNEQRLEEKRLQLQRSLTGRLTLRSITSGATIGNADIMAISIAGLYDQMLVVTVQAVDRLNVAKVGDEVNLLFVPPAPPPPGTVLAASSSSASVNGAATPQPESVGSTGSSASAEAAEPVAEIIYGAVILKIDKPGSDGTIPMVVAFSAEYDELLKRHLGRSITHVIYVTTVD